MSFTENIKSFYYNHKQEIVYGASIIATFALASLGYAISNDSSDDEWMKTASEEELRSAYEVERLEFCRTGYRTPKMNQLNDEMNRRSTSTHTKSPYRWTDENRWD